MLAKCNNPSCSAKFRYLHEGKLFRLEVESTREPRIEYFWLCGHCAGTMGLSLNSDGEIIISSVQQAPRQDHQATYRSWHANGRLLVHVLFSGRDARALVEEV